jgi:hypothetical protein
MPTTRLYFTKALMSVHNQTKRHISKPNEQWVVGLLLLLCCAGPKNTHHLQYHHQSSSSCNVWNCSTALYESYCCTHSTVCMPHTRNCQKWAHRKNTCRYTATAGTHVTDKAQKAQPLQKVPLFLLLAASELPTRVRQEQIGISALLPDRIEATDLLQHVIAMSLLMHLLFPPGPAMTSSHQQKVATSGVSI